MSAAVPSIFRSFAQENLAYAGVRSIEPSDAVNEARTLLRRSPFPAEHVSLLAIAEERAGNHEASARLIQEAARRGWRDPIAQQAMFDLALQAGDTDEAARRLAAIYAIGDEQSPITEMRNRLLAAPQGKEALARMLLAGGRWTQLFLRTVRVDPDFRAIQSISTALSNGGKLDCVALHALKKSLMKQGRTEETESWQSCSSAERRTKTLM